MPNWYNPKKTLTHNALYNLIIGARSVGKSYNVLMMCIDKFKKTGKQFVYLRRYATELDESKETIFDQIIIDNQYPDDKITFEGDCYFLNGQLMGFAMALTKAKSYKSSAYPNVWVIIYEEFIIEEDGHSHYLKGEVKKFLGFYMTIDRYRGVKVFFLGNNYTMFNPYTIYWKIDSPNGRALVKAKKGSILLELIPDTIKEHHDSQFAKIIEGTDFAEYAIHNKSYVDNNTFVAKKTDKANYFFGFIYEGEKYGVWRDFSVGKLFVSKDIDPYNKILYSMTNDDHRPNTVLLRSISKSGHFKLFIECYKDGDVYFENMKIKSITLEVIKMCLGGR